MIFGSRFFQSHGTVVTQIWHPLETGRPADFQSLELTAMGNFQSLEFIVRIAVFWCFIFPMCQIWALC
jgi:hypothetical protein